MDNLADNLFDEDLSMFPDDEESNEDKLSAFTDLIGLDKLNLELESRGVPAETEMDRTIYQYAITGPQMEKVRAFSKQKLKKFNSNSSWAEADTIKGGMGEIAWTMLLRSYFDIFGYDPSLVKVNLRVTPVNDGGNDTRIAGVKFNVKFANNESSGIFMSQADLDKVGLSDYYILVNGESLANDQLIDPKYDSFPVVISGCVHKSDLVKEKMTFRKNRQDRDRWVFERKNMDNVNVAIRKVLDEMEKAK